jgi:hypothetical protein
VQPRGRAGEGQVTVAHGCRGREDARPVPAPNTSPTRACVASFNAARAV